MKKEKRLTSWSEVLLGSIVRAGLEVAGGANGNLDGAVKAEGVVEHVIVVSNGGDGTAGESSALDHSEIVEAPLVATASAVTREREVQVVLEDADSILVDDGLVSFVVGEIQHRRTEGAVEALNQSAHVSSETVVGIVVNWKVIVSSLIPKLKRKRTKGDMDIPVLAALGWLPAY
jgi:hypothetical protein